MHADVNIRYVNYQIKFLMGKYLTANVIELKF